MCISYRLNVFDCIFENPSHILSITKAVIVSNFIEKKRECVKYVQYHIQTAHSAHTKRTQAPKTKHERTERSRIALGV